MEKKKKKKTFVLFCFIKHDAIEMTTVVSLSF